MAKSKGKASGGRGNIKSAHIGSLYTKDTEVYRLTKRRKTLNERFKKATNPEEITEITQKLNKIKEKLDNKNKFWKSNSKQTPDTRPSAVVSIPIEEYLKDKSSSDNIEDKRSIAAQAELSQSVKLEDDFSDFTILTPQEIGDLILSNDDEALLASWTDRFNRIGDRESAAKVFARVRFLQGIDKIQKNFTDYIGHELVTVFPFEDISLSITSPLSAEIKQDKKKALISQTLREGQASFRSNLIKCYGCKCMVTGETIDSIIEAAHIIPYCGPDSNRIENGLLLRVDIHRLFDQGLLTIHPSSNEVCVSPMLESSSYWRLNGKKLIVNVPFLAIEEYLKNRWGIFLKN
tara:strand:+ start:7545 stop:8588 length:1044 start_codon:yes stop_codon:yes gene_type:complete